MTISPKCGTEALHDQFPWRQIRLLSRRKAEKCVLNEHEQKRLSQEPRDDTDMTVKLHNHEYGEGAGDLRLGRDDSWEYLCERAGQRIRWMLRTCRHPLFLII